MPKTQSEIFDHVLSLCDLTDPSDFLVALYYAEQFPKPQPLDYARFNRDIAIVERYHAQIFDRAGRQRAKWATQDMLMSLADDDMHRMRRKWLAVFRAAFAQGLINRVVFGTAVSSLFTSGYGNPTPGLTDGSAAQHAMMLDDMKRSSPLGLMCPLERRQWRALPDVVTVYRGGVSVAGHAGDAKARVVASKNSIFWTPRPGYANAYLIRRRADAENAAIKGSIPALSRAFSGLSQIGYQPSVKVVTPYIVRAEVPRELVLAYWRALADIGGKVTEEVELILDVDRLSADMITDVTPQSAINTDAWAA